MEEKTFTIVFSSVDQKINNFQMKCRNDDLIVNLEEKLYNEFPEFKDANTYLLISFLFINNLLISQIKVKRYL